VSKRRAPLSTFPLAAVRWLDAHGNALGDYNLGEIRRDFHKPEEYWSFGLLVQDDEVGVTLASEQSGDTVRGISFIPRGMVGEVILLGPPVRPRPAASRAVSTRLPPEPPGEVI
jgi:hypothetical protein